MARTSERRQGRGVPDKRQAILQVAARLFAERGYENTPTKMIAGEAGVAEGTVFVHFPTKKAILMALLEELILHSLKHTLEEVKGMSDRDVIYSIILGRLRLWKEHSGLLKAIIAQMLFDLSLAELFITRVTDPAIKVMSDFVARRQREGAFRGKDPVFAVPAMIGQVIALGIMNSVAPNRFQLDNRLEDYATQMTDMFLGGIRK
jgi:AcrR family transcriptional regulator